MKTLIVVSRCVRKLSNSPVWEFHFKGVYAGYSISHLHLFPAAEMCLVKNDEYIAWVELLSIEGTTLRGRILRLRKLDEVAVC